jgi:hypothetical protein
MKESVYSAVRTASLYKAHYVSSLKGSVKLIFGSIWVMSLFYFLAACLIFLEEN